MEKFLYQLFAKLIFYSSLRFLPTHPSFFLEFLMVYPLSRKT
jgi:hypothetical protein